MSHWHPKTFNEIEEKSPWEKIQAWAKSKQEVLAVAAILVLLLSVGVPYYLQSRDQASQDAAQKLNLAQYYLGAKVDPKNGPFKSEKEKYETASQEFHQITQQDAGTWAARVAGYYAAKCDLILEKYPQAYVEFDEASQRLKGKPLGEAALVGKAVALALQEKWKEASAVYEDYLARYPAGFLVSQARLQLADAYRKSGDSAKGMEQLKALVKDDPKSEEGLEAARLMKTPF